MMNTRTKWLSACLAACLVASATPAAAQQGGQSAGQSPDHAGHQGRGHDAMQAREFRNLQQGRGMGMGRAAETNGYPGPMHVLQHAAALELTDGQIERTRELMTRVKTRAPALGQQVIDAEKQLEAMFAEGSVNAAKMDALLLEIAELRAHLRSLHLTAHLDQAAVLTETQLEQYKALRSTDSEARRPMRRMREMKREGQSDGN